MHPDEVASVVNLSDASCESCVGGFVVRVVRIS